MRFFLPALSILILTANLGCHSTRPPTADSASFKEKLAKAESGDAEAQFYVGVYYVEGRYVPQNQAEAMKWFRKAADQGHAEAQANLGWGYYRGLGVAVDTQEAVKWINKAADQGNAKAKIMLAAILLETGDYAEAYRKLQKLADQGDASAQNMLGLVYQQGLGVTKDETEAVKWFREAAEQKDASGEAMLGLSYFEGQGVARDYKEAIKWSRRAAAEGNSVGQSTLGRCYQEGKGVNQNAREAVKWFRRAAQQEDGVAEVGLGRAYRVGQGVPQDYVQAYKWFDLAAVRENVDATAEREDLISLMTPEQLAQAGAVPRRHLTKFDRQIINAHEQRYDMSCIPSSVEMVLKLTGRVPSSYYEQQDVWKNKSDGSFHNFDGKMIAGVTFHQQFTQAHNKEFPLAELFATIDRELQAGRFVIVGIAVPSGTHNWVIYDEDTEGDFLAISKTCAGTIEDKHVKKTITNMHSTDIGTYDLKP